MSLAEAKEHALQYPGVDKQYVRGDVDVVITGTVKHVRRTGGRGLPDCLHFMPRPRSGCGLHNSIDIDAFDIETASIPDVDDTVTESAWKDLIEGVDEATMQDEIDVKVQRQLFI